MTSRNSLAVLAAALSVCSAQALAAEEAGSTDLSTIQANGAPEPIRTGFFTETAIGGFLTIGGQNYSNTEAFLALGVGYDIIQNLSVGLQFQLAPSAADCYATTCTGSTGAAATFTITTLDLKLSYRVPVADRLFVPIRAFGGIAILSPDPTQPSSPTGAGAGSSVQPSFGLASGIEWATPFDHFNIGFEVAGREVLGISAFALSFYPTFKYTF